MKRSSLRLAALLGILLLSSVWLFGQAESGLITGNVTDTSNAVVVGAKVTIVSANTGLTRSTTTNSAGEYTLTNLKPDTYNMTIEGTGFQKYARQVQVLVGSKNEVSAKLNVTGVSTTVEVTASGETASVNTESQTLSTVVTSQQLTDLPTLTRNPYDLVATSGNVSNGDSGQNLRGVGYAINGQRSASTDILLDGGENVDLFTAAVGQSVPLDSVQEFRIVTSDFSAEYGRASGGVVNVTTKSGTNAFHGTLFEFNRVAALASNTYDNNAQRAQAYNDGTCVVGQSCSIGANPGFTRNQFGYSIGGPILKNKLFFFSATEWTRVRSSSNVTQVIVDPAYLPFAGQATQAFFAAYGSTFRPGLSVLNHLPFSSSGSTALPANTPFAETVQYSVPSDSGAGSPQNTYSTVARVDYNFSDRTTLYGRYALYSENDLAGSVNNSPYAGYDTGQTNFNQNVTINLTHVFTTSLVSSTKLIYNRLTNLQPLGAVPVSPTLYVGATGVPKFGPNLADFVFPGYSQTTPGNAIPFGGPQNLYQIYEDISWTKGRHQFKFGGLYIQTRDNRVFGAYENAVQAFNASGTSMVNTANSLTTGNIGFFQAAIYPQGLYPCNRDVNTGAAIVTPQCTLQLPVGPPAFNRNNRYNDGAFYANDSWKITPKLVLNLGIRWEYYGVQHNANPALDSNFYLGSGGTLQDQIRNGSTQIANQSPVGGLWAPNKNNWAPRVGFAYDVLGNGTLSLRGGYGIAYERNFGNVTFNVIQNPPNYGVIGLTAGQDIPSMPIFVSNVGPLAGSGITKAFPGVSLRAVDQNIKQAYANFWSFASDYQVLKNSVLSLEYTGSYGVHQYSIANINKPYFGQVYLGDTRAINPTSGSGGNRLNLQDTTMNYRGSNGTNHYDALNVKFASNNLFNKGLYFNANYTWSHAIDNNSSTFGEGGNGNNQLGYTDPFNPNLDKGNSEYDIRHRFVFSGTWNLPWGTNSSNGFVKQALGGWQLSPIYAVRSGNPYTIYDCTNAVSNCPRWATTGVVPLQGSPVAVGYDNFNYLQLPTDSSGSVVGLGNSLEVPGKYNTQLNGYFCGGAAVLSGSNYSCNGVAPAQRNSWYGPMNQSFNLVIAKMFKLNERFNLQFRTEMYNVFNHSNYYITTANTDISATSVITAQKGVVPNANNERRNIQFGLKLNF